MDVPEKILCQAHVQPGSVADFLHENGTSFPYASVDILHKNWKHISKMKMASFFNVLNPIQ